MSPTRATHPLADHNATQAVLEIQAKFWKALQAKNRTAFEQVLAEDFVVRSPGESNLTRDSFIETLVGFPGKVVQVGSDNLEVHLFGDLAVISGVQSAKLEMATGQLVSNTIAITNILQRTDGEWRMRLSHAVELEKP